jgi:hypothetical protein
VDATEVFEEFERETFEVLDAIEERIQRWLDKQVDCKSMTIFNIYQKYVDELIAEFAEVEAWYEDLCNRWFR